MNKRKIIFYNPSFESGGVETNIKNLILLFSNNKKYSVNLLTGKKKIKIFEKNYHSIFPNFLIKFCHNRISSYFLCSLVLFYHCIKSSCIILSFQNNIFAIIIAKLTNSKIVIRLNTSPDKYIKNYITKKIFKFFYMFSDAIICNSQEFVKKIKFYFNIKSNLILNFINFDYINKKKCEKIKLKFKNKKTLKILNIGRLTYQKNQILILKAIKNFKINYHLIILGSGNELENLKEYCLKNNLNKKVSFINFTKNPYKYINWCDLFILSSKYEGMPNVLIEAGYLKKNIISSNCPTGPKELIRNQKNGYLFKNNSVVSLISTIKKFYNDKNNNKKKENLYMDIKKTYNNQKNFQKLIKILDNI